uniref:EF-hand domain-containing protein n=1 Tax=Cajanus cajan TaxID=3821 RepID=A0A151S817_CAJCA|nr:hypothetical protein KK1_027264 [Cajanus cajan]
MSVFIPNRMPGSYKSKSLPPNIITAEKKIRDTLRKADFDGDGCLNKDELEKAFKEFGSKLPAWRAGHFLKKADTNHDGLLAGEELDIVVDFALSNYKFKK